MTSAYQDLAHALRTRLQVIGDQNLRARDPELQLTKLREASEAIASAQTKLVPPVDPRLGHYLERCSYDKALAWLEEQ